MQPTAIMNFCPTCGTDLHAQEGCWPKRCPNPDCKKPEHWHPVLTVAVCLVYTPEGVLVIKRRIPPQRGGWALPAGYQNFGETVDEAAARELREETGLRVPAAELYFVKSALSSTGMSLVFFGANLPDFDPGQLKLCPEEVEDWKIATRGDQLCFPSHQEALDEYFAERDQYNG